MTTSPTRAGCIRARKPPRRWPSFFATGERSAANDEHAVAANFATARGTDPCEHRSVVMRHYRGQGPSRDARGCETLPMSKALRALAAVIAVAAIVAMICYLVFVKHIAIE